MRRLRVAYAIQNVDGINLDQDLGDAVPVKHTLRGLRAAGHAVTLVRLRGREVGATDELASFQPWRSIPSGFPDTRVFQLAESGIRRVQRMLRLPYFASFDSLRFSGALRRILLEHDLCHEHGGLFCAGAALACLRLGKPYVLTFSADGLLESDLVGQPLRGLHRLVAAWEARFTYRVATRIVCVSEAARAQLVTTWKVHPAKISVVPNGVDSQVFRPGGDGQKVRGELGLDRAPVICFVGGFHAWHGIDHLVKSFARVLTLVPGARLLLVGDGPARPEIERAIALHGVGRSVHLTGVVPQARVPELLAASDVAVLPYPRLPKELWFSPLKLFEYMAAGKAIVASRAGQVAEVIEDGTSGYLVTPGDEVELAQRLAALLQRPDERERLGRAARKQAIERHSWARYIRQLESVYEQALESSPRSPVRVAAETEAHS
jgi:glycosyltransferase involved in cell wall biosynthesis